MKYAWYLLFLPSFHPVLMCQETQFRSFYQNQGIYNPAANSKILTPQFTYLARWQWISYYTSFDGSGGEPISQQLLFMYPFPKTGVTLSSFFLQDQLGPLRNNSIQGSLSYRVKISRQEYLSFGIASSYSYRYLQHDLYRSHIPEDPLILSFSSSPTEDPYFHSGIYYQTQTIAVGMGIRNLWIREENPNPSTNVSPAHIRSYLHGSYVFHLNRKISTRIDKKRRKRIRQKTHLSLSPRFLFQTDYKKLHTLNMSMNLNYHQQFELELGTRNVESTSIMVGYHLLYEKNLFLGCAFDLSVQHQQVKSPSSYEILLNYRLPNFSREKKPIQTPRYIHESF
ncbi:MAG: PorP/SprF family type IX secretion system membrane protein [Cytophagales bacterium]|nr:PorP/SprF family type IX secretion system membrane protein [Cytophagales bacterium]